MEDLGCFYIIQLEPDLDPGRFKVGFTTELDGRLRKHRCSAPFSVVIRSWPCRRRWEPTALDAVADGAERLHTEVFRVPDIGIVLAQAQRFFSVMPDLGQTLDVE